MVVDEFLRLHIYADMNTRMESHAFSGHLFTAPVDDVFFHLEVRDAEPKQTADDFVLLVEVHVMSNARELLCGGHARRTGADNRDLLAGFL